MSRFSIIIGAYDNHAIQSPGCSLLHIRFPLVCVRLDLVFRLFESLGRILGILATHEPKLPKVRIRELVLVHVFQHEIGCIPNGVANLLNPIVPLKSFKRVI